MKKSALIVSFAPHWHSGTSIASTMYTIVLALLPALLYGMYLFGIDGARVVGISVLTCVVSEYIILKLFKKPITITDGSAVVAGLLFGMILPSGSPFWLVMVGAFMAMLVGKHVFGGLGSNPFNCVLVGWAMVKISWKFQMNFNLLSVKSNLDIITGYPLGILKKAGVTGLDHISLIDLFVGREIGGIGYTSALLLCLGGLFLLLRGVIPWRTPVAFIIGILVTSSLFNLGDSTKYAGPLFNLFTGATMFGAFFLITDYSSSPVNKTSMLIFGFGCGVLTILLRSWSMYEDGTFFAILLMNIATPFLDKIGERKVITVNKDKG